MRAGCFGHKYVKLSAKLPFRHAVLRPAPREEIIMAASKSQIGARTFVEQVERIAIECVLTLPDAA